MKSKIKIGEAPKCQSRDSIEDIWGPRMGYKHEWPIRVDEAKDEEPDKWVQSACVLCSNGCGMDIGVKNGRVVGVRGRATDRVNHGRLGPKGLHGVSKPSLFRTNITQTLTPIVENHTS